MSIHIARLQACHAELQGTYLAGDIRIKPPRAHIPDLPTGVGADRCGPRMGARSGD